MKKAYLIHGWKAGPETTFFPWLRRHLEQAGYQVSAPAMPHPNVPQVEEWLACLKTTIQQPDEDTLIIAHSLGALATMFFLQELPMSTKVGRVILVAPPLVVPKTLSAAEVHFSRPWFVRPLDQAKIKGHITDFLMVFSDNDQRISLENEVYAREVFGVKTILEHNMGHYSRESTPEVEATVPRVLEEALRPMQVES